MEYIYAIILGIVQGVTEFLPISSSGHLLLLHELFNFATANDLTFDIALHAGTLLSISLFFAHDIVHYVHTQPKLIWLILLSSLPAGVIGLMFEDIIATVFRSSWIVVVMLIVVAGIFLLVEQYARPQGSLQQLTWKQALAMGIAQTIALIPGTSRSGITLVTGMWLGLKRVEAAKFSFIMTIPLLIGLTIKQLLVVLAEPPATQDLVFMGIGALTAAVVGMLVIGFLLNFLKTATLRPFAYYRIGLAVVVSLTLLL